VHQIAAPTGVGKSTEVRSSAVRTIKMIADYLKDLSGSDAKLIFERFNPGPYDPESEPSFVLAVPHHALSDELIAAFKKEFAGEDIEVAVWRGMLGDDPEQPGQLMCHRPDDIRKLRDAGLSSSELCSQRRDDGTIEYCPFFEKCGYQRQKAMQARIWIVAHETLVHQKPAALGDVMRIYIDEHFIDAFMFGIESPNLLPLSAIVAEPNDITDLKHRQVALYEMIRELPDGPIPLASLPAWGAEICMSTSKLEWRLKQDPGIDPGMQGDALAKALSAVSGNNTRVRQRATMWRLLGELFEAGYERSGRLRLVTKGRQRFLEMKGVRHMAKGWDEVPILITDATADIEMIKAIWPQAVETLATQRLPTPHARVFQIVDTGMSKLSCSPSDPHASARKDGDNDTDNRKRAAMAQKLWATIVALGLKYGGGGKVGVITYKGTEAWITTNCAEVPPWISMMHFGEVSGRNDFGDVSLLIDIGRPLPPAEAVTRHAEALWGEAIDAEESVYVETTDVIETVADAQGYSTPIRALRLYRHPNPKVERIRRQICEGALIQVAGRARAALRTADNPVTIVVMADIPVPELGPVEPLVWADIAPTVDQVMLAMHGAMLENLTHAANVAPEIVTSKESLKKARQREVGDISLREYTSYRGMSPTSDLLPPDPSLVRLDYFSYRLPGAGQKLASGVRLTSATQPSSAWLVDQVGEPADFRRYPPMDADLSITIASGWLPWRKR
jgi:putative DNA primase/helicase